MHIQHLPIYKIQDFEVQAQKTTYFYFSSFATYLQKHLFIQKPHKHDFYIILIVTKGTGVHSIDFKEHEVTPGTVFFLTPGQVHSWKLSEDADGFIIFFTQSFYIREYPARMLYDFPFFNALFSTPFLHLEKEQLDALMPVLDFIQQEYAQKKPFRQVLLSRYLDILLLEISRIYKTPSDEPGISGHEHAVLQNLERLLETYFKEHKPVAFYADQLHTTTKHLNEICKKTLGKTSKELIQDRVILEAQRLLIHAGLTSSQIAAELGYFDNTYFFRFFKKQTGCTPEQFRTANTSNYR